MTYPKQLELQVNDLTVDIIGDTVYKLHRIFVIKPGLFILLFSFHAVDKRRVSLEVFSFVMRKQRITTLANDMNRIS